MILANLSYSRVNDLPVLCTFAVALLAEGVDRNIRSNMVKVGIKYVALLAEGVDRNPNPITENRGAPVALLAEGVDRNLFCL